MLKNILIVVGFVLLQEFVFNNVQIATLMTPYVYILPILVLPFSYSPVAIVVISFLLGLSVDYFSTSQLGLHASACLAMGYARKFVYKFVSTKSDSDETLSPTIYKLAWRPYVVYTSVLILIHHTILFFLESLKLENLQLTVFRILLSAAISMLFIVTLQLAFFRRENP